MKNASILTTVLLLAISQVCFAGTIHVPGDQPTIQAGIDAASAGDVVLVAPGTYGELIDFKGKAIIVRSDVDGDPATHDISYATTFIDGGNPPHPDYGSVVTFSSGEGLDSVLEGFTITNGAGTLYELYPGFWYPLGGGVYCLQSSPTLSNNRIKGNAAVGGAGIFCLESSSPAILNSKIIDNTGDHGDGGGIGCRHGSSPTITNTLIMGNETYPGYGGGIYCTDDSSPIIENTTISDNDAMRGGGIYCIYSTPTIIDTTMTGNNAHNLGGGIYCHESSPTIANTKIIANSSGSGGGISLTYDSAPLITDTLIMGNSVQINGGGVYCYTSTPIISNTMIMGNTAIEGLGAGIYCYGASPIITNTSIVENTAEEGDGGGIYCYVSSPTITNSTLTGNSAYNSGGGVYCIFSSSPTLANTILWDNTVSDGEGPEVCLQTDLASSTLAISFSNVRGGTSLVHIDPGCSLNWGAGMINADPLFVNPTYNDYHLSYNSPCKDAGDNTMVEELFDFETDPRIVNGTVDMC